MLSIADTEDLTKSDSLIPKDAKLKMVTVVFRDAARTPLTERYTERGMTWSMCSSNRQAPKLQLQTPSGQAVPPKQPHSHKALAGGCQMGMITDVGYKQAEDLGTWLRSRYLTKLQDPATKDHELLQAHSTHHTRSLTSLQAVLQGMLQGGGAGGAAGAVPEGGVPVVVRPQDQELMYANAHACHALGVLMKKADLETRKVGDEGPDEMQRDTAQGVRIFMKLPAQDSSGWVSWKRLLDAIMCLEAHNQTLPRGLSNMLYRTIDKEATTRVSAVLGPHCKGSGPCQQLLQLSTGMWLGELSARLNASSACSSLPGDAGVPACADMKGPRVYLHSAHDSTLMPLMAVLGFPLREWPPFSSSLVVELWQLDKGVGPATHAVRVLYNMKPVDLASALEGSGVSAQPAFPAAGLFSLEQLHSLFLGKYLVQGEEQYKKLCSAQVPDKEE
eukprot:CAMPEP_0202896474 /NCGR_PEP_ID=MMETSP1392-20130828/5471_1 /ASSEMBLY_ACC=CAM_ASM_000868 /TAXON_ID=225041 /ORGANISM="Chlamydomonas chlamydogama, Strain SAG 11-48b" /LENGTH=444 /DNA_ID=CAMNT_0049581845 /DNA_START=76 /DNA_END=1407 /DNA_ORIENTATION=+